MSNKDVSSIVLENKSPIKSAVRGQTLYVYDPTMGNIISGTVETAAAGTVISGTVETAAAGTVILRTKSGLHSYWMKECFTEKEEPSQELEVRLHPVRERLVSELKTVSDLLSFCISSDFKNDKDAADMRQAVSIRAKELLGIDPFENDTSDGQGVA